MSVQAVVKKDFQDGIRSKLLWVLMALFLLIIGGLSWLVTRNSAPDDGDIAIIALMGISAIFAVIFLVPLTGLVVSIKSIVRERELGSLRILLSLPHTRGEVIVGKFLGRSALLVLAILVGFVPAGLLFMLNVDNFPMVEYLMFIFVLILFGIAFVAVGIGVSSMVKTETRATVAGIAVFLVLYAWNGIINFINGQLGLLSGNALDFVLRFHLMNVFFDMLVTLLLFQYDSQDVSDDGGFFGSIEQVSQPFYLEPWFAFVILAIWVAVPLAVGYFRFERADL